MNKENEPMFKLYFVIEIFAGIVMIIIGLYMSRLMLSGIEPEMEKQGLIMLIIMTLGSFTVTLIGVMRIIGRIKILIKLNSKKESYENIETQLISQTQEEVKKVLPFKAVFLIGIMLAVIIYDVNAITSDPENTISTIIMSFPFIIVPGLFLYKEFKR